MTVIWQGNLGDVYEGQKHRIRQIAEDDCIVELARDDGDGEWWTAEETDWVCANAYMMALLAERKAAGSSVPRVSVDG